MDRRILLASMQNVLAMILESAQGAQAKAETTNQERWSLVVTEARSAKGLLEIFPTRHAITPLQMEMDLAYLADDLLSLEEELHAAIVIAIIPAVRCLRA